MRRDTLADSRGLVGIIANPASGKDIRRLVAHATTIDNQGKVSTLRRALMGLGAVGVRAVIGMPDAYQLCLRALEGVGHDGQPTPSLELLDMEVTGNTADTEQAAALLRAAGAGCIIVLGGDGTVRAASKGAGDVPLLPISTGTNNVLPQFVEGTVAGLAAGGIALGLVSGEQATYQHKWLELHVGGAPVDRALVDVAVLSGRFVGSRAVWNAAALRQIIVTRADPTTIGISAIAGAVRPTAVDEPVGVVIDISSAAKRRVLAAVGPGLLQSVGIESVREVAVGQQVSLPAERPLVVALDGEREVTMYEETTAFATLRGDGPRVVDVHRTMCAMVSGGHLER
ncbi:MAG: NAD(+)/NADH kinase [Anaerolineae bacterium]